MSFMDLTTVFLLVHKVVPLALDEHKGLKDNELISLFYLQNWNRRHPA